MRYDKENNSTNTNIHKDQINYSSFSWLSSFN